MNFPVRTRGNCVVIIIFSVFGFGLEQGHGRKHDSNNDEMEEEKVEENDPEETEADDGDAPDPTTGPVGQTTEL